jgi:hypothetical protein
VNEYTVRLSEKSPLPSGAYTSQRLSRDIRVEWPAPFHNTY